MKKNVLVCGSVVRDIFLNIPGLITKEDNFVISSGKKEPISDIYLAIGGGGANASVNFARLDQQVYLCAAFPDNEIGKTLKHDLEAQHIDLRYSEHYDATESFSVIFPASGNQAIFSYAGTNDLLKMEKLDKKMAQNIDLWYVAPLHGNARRSFFELLYNVQYHKPFIFVNPSFDQIMDQDRYLFRSLPYISALQCNYKEAHMLLQRFFEEKGGSQARDSQVDGELDLFFSTLHQKGVDLIIVTHGKQGVYISYQEEIYHLSMPELEVKNTVGAGDAFASTFAAFFLETKDIFQSCYMAATQVFSVLQSCDAQSGLRSKETLLDRLADIKSQFNVKRLR